MKTKILNLLLILTSLFGYLEWGGNQHQFLFQVESVIFTKLLTSPGEVLHPFIILPLLGQILLLITLFQQKVSRVLTFSGMAAMSILLLLILLIGIMSTNLRIIGSVLPFSCIAVYTVIYHRSLNNIQI